MKKKPLPKIVSWFEYNQALMPRGSLTFWIDEEVIGGWYCKGRSGRRGASGRYRDFAIQTALMVNGLFCLPLRGVEGFVRLVLALMDLELESPDYSALTKRAKRLSVKLPGPVTERHCHVVVDGTGLKVYGEGEWTVRIHGQGTRLVSRNLHLAVDVETHDAEVPPDLLEEISVSIENLYGDDAYGAREVYAEAAEAAARNIRLVVLPLTSAVVWEDRHPPMQALKDCSRHSRKAWKRTPGYYRRSVAKTAMYRYKQIIGPTLTRRGFDCKRRTLVSGSPSSTK